MILVTNKQIEAVKKKLHDEEINLKRLEREYSRMRVRRQEFQQNIDDVCSENPAAANALRRFDRDVLRRGLLEYYFSSPVVGETSS